MAIDALLARSADCSSATTFTLTGPKNYGDEAADYVDEIDLHGRLPFDQTFALVANVEGPVGGNGTVIVESDDAADFPSDRDEYTFTNVINTTSGRNGDGTGPHLCGYITGPLQRFIRFKVTASADIGVVEVFLTRDWPTGDLA